MGSAIGLGSIWKFPYEVGENGGAGFILFYALGLLLVVLPLMLAEMAIGRHGQGDAVASIQRAARQVGWSPRWQWVGVLAICGGGLILAYYAVIGGLTLAYLLQALRHGFAGTEASSAQALFASMTAAPLSLAGWQALFLGLTALVVARGIGAGIEALCRVLMPLLILLMLGLAGYALALGDVGAALRFLFHLQPAQITARMALEALGLGFFSIGVGLGVMITYAAHAGREISLMQVAWATLLGDSAISLVAGLAIFPLVFAHGLAPDQGTGLMFVTLPIAFARLPHGDAVGALFFLALVFAALASAISLLELALEPLLRRTGWRRAPAAMALAALLWVAGLPAVLSFNLGAGFHPLASLPGFGAATMLEVMDRLASNLLLPAAGVLLAVFAGFGLGPARLRQELQCSPATAAMLIGLLRWAVPGLILAFLLLGHLGE